MEVSEIWYLHSFFFYEFFKSVTIHPGAFWYSGVNCDTRKKTAKKEKKEKVNTWFEIDFQELYNHSTVFVLARKLMVTRASYKKVHFSKLTNFRFRKMDFFSISRKII